MTAVLAVQGLSVVAGRQAILEDVSLELREGEILVVAGPSGGGKTTLLRTLAGLVAPTAGEVRVGGVLASAARRVIVPPERRRIAMVFQDLALWPHLTVHGNLAFGLAAQGVARGERARRIAEVLDWVGLAGKAARYPGQLSGGERQRVALARALVLEPVALLLDEPLTSLDVAIKSELLDLLRGLLRTRRVPTLYVSHEPREASALADRLVLLEAGRVSYSGELATLAHEAKTTFGRLFAASFPAPPSG
ncbi:MAG: ABC transporter ATP-binding protein [Deltaproteobacteria bacterium]|nr:ABC transporter ATP-binding protein [Deltaproteobacteria bacterium]